MPRAIGKRLSDSMDKTRPETKNCKKISTNMIILLLFIFLRSSQYISICRFSSPIIFYFLLSLTFHQARTCLCMIAFTSLQIIDDTQDHLMLGFKFVCKRVLMLSLPLNKIIVLKFILFKH